MTFTKSAKLIGASVLMAGFMSGSAFAGDKKDCKNKDHTSAYSTQTQSGVTTVVLPARTEINTYTPTPQASTMAQDATAKTQEMKVLTFDEALAKCQKYGATDLQACIDKKTGQAPKS